MRRLNGLVGVVVLVTAALCGGDCLAITDEEIFRAFEFNFANPGARAVGLGGAFIAAADDATAAQANPAALHYLSRMEFFAEYRASQQKTTVFSSTSGSLTPFPAGLYLPYVNIQNVSAPQDTSDISFLSFVYPFKVGKDTRLRLAFSRQVVLDVNTSLADGGTTTNSTFALPTFPSWTNPATGQVEQYTVHDDVNGALDTRIIYYNFGFSSSITRDFSIGATGTWATLDMKSNTTGTISDPRGLLDFVNPRSIGGNGTFPDVITGTAVDGTDSNFAYALGVHWHPDSVFPGGYSPIRFGVVYHRGADFAVDEIKTEGGVQVGQPFSNVLKVPDRFGLGVSYEFGGGKTRPWLASLDVERIEYSDLLEGFNSGVNFFTNGTLPPDILQTDPNGKITYTVDDATVFHFGLEYNNVSRGGWTQAIRAGYYNDPDKRIRMTEFNSLNQEVNDLYLNVFSGGSSVNHYTVGFSVGRSPARGQSVTLQFAGDFSDVSNVYVGSLLWRFGKRGQ